MIKIVYTGPFKVPLQNHVQLKKAMGRKYDINAAHLKRFDRFTLEKYPDAMLLTKKIVLDWCKKTTYESQANQCARATFLRQFAKYLDSIGVDAYIIPKRYFPTEPHYVPYIYTVDELRRFFAQTDRYRFHCLCPWRHLIMPVIFRMIYMCGLRVSEARLLKVANVDLVHGVLSILHSKEDNDRLVPMSECLTERCRLFAAQVHRHSAPDDYFFPGFFGKPMTLKYLYYLFRKVLWCAGISHGGRGSGPRIHDFRHTYAVHCLKQLAEQKKDLTVYLPILKTYMGHQSFYETAYYLRMTADVFPEITLKMETCYPEIIPTLQGENNEND